MKMRPDVLGTMGKESGRAKNENGIGRPRYRPKRIRERKTRKRDLTPSVPPKNNLGAQNYKTGPVTLGTAENEYGLAKHENVT
jgi:hypothetical protein